MNEYDETGCYDYDYENYDPNICHTPQHQSLSNFNNYNKYQNDPFVLNPFDDDLQPKINPFSTAKTLYQSNTKTNTSLPNIPLSQPPVDVESYLEQHNHNLDDISNDLNNNPMQESNTINEFQSFDDLEQFLSRGQSTLSNQYTSQQHLSTLHSQFNQNADTSEPTEFTLQQIDYIMGYGQNGFFRKKPVIYSSDSDYDLPTQSNYSRFYTDNNNAHNSSSLSSNSLLGRTGRRLQQQQLQQSRQQVKRNKRLNSTTSTKTTSTTQTKSSNHLTSASRITNPPVNSVNNGIYSQSVNNSHSTSFNQNLPQFGPNNNPAHHQSIPIQSKSTINNNIYDIPNIDLNPMKIPLINIISTKLFQSSLPSTTSSQRLSLFQQFQNLSLDNHNNINNTTNNNISNLINQIQIPDNYSTFEQFFTLPPISTSHDITKSQLQHYHNFIASLIPCCTPFTEDSLLLHLAERCIAMGNCNISIGSLARIVSAVINSINLNKNNQSITSTTQVPFQLQCFHPIIHNHHHNNNNQQDPIENNEQSLPSTTTTTTTTMNTKSNVIQIPKTSSIEIYYSQPIQPHNSDNNVDINFTNITSSELNTNTDYGQATTKIQNALNTIKTSVTIPLDDTKDALWLAHKWQQVLIDMKQSSRGAKYFDNQ